MKILYLILFSYLVISSPTITLQPQSENLCYGTEDFELSIQAISNSGTLNYQWMRYGKDLVAGIDSPFETNQASLKFFPADYEMSGVYTCDIWEAGETRESAITTNTAVVYVVQKPEIVDAPEFVYSKKGELFKIKIDASGEDLEFQWFEIDSYFKDTTILVNDFQYSGVNSNLLTINFYQKENIRKPGFICKVFNNCGQLISNFIPYFVLPDSIFFSRGVGRDLGVPCEGMPRYLSANFVNRPVFWDSTYWNGYKETNPNSKFRTEFIINNKKFDQRINVLGIYSQYIIEHGKKYEIEVRANFDNVLFDTLKETFQEFPNLEFLKGIEDIELKAGTDFSFNFKYLNGYSANSGVKYILINSFGNKLSFEKFRVEEISSQKWEIEKQLTFLNFRVEDSGNYRLIIEPYLSNCNAADTSNIFKIEVLPKQEQPLSVDNSKYEIISSPNPFYLQNKLEFNLEKASKVKIELNDALECKLQF